MNRHHAACRRCGFIHPAHNPCADGLRVNEPKPQAREDAQPVAWEVAEFQEARRRIAAFRIREYLARHAKNTHGDRVAIHSYDLGEDDETRLLISDLEAVSATQTHTAPDALRAAAAALKPFAMAARGLSSRWGDHETHWQGATSPIAVEDLRRADQALAALQAEQKGGA